MKMIIKLNLKKTVAEEIRIQIKQNIDGKNITSQNVKCEYAVAIEEVA